MPLDESGALRWFLSSVYVASTPTKLIGEIAIRTLLGSSARGIGTLAPFHATVRDGPAGIRDDFVERDSRRDRKVRHIAFDRDDHSWAKSSRSDRLSGPSRRGTATRGEDSKTTELRSADAARTHDGQPNSPGPRSPDGDSIPRSHEVLELRRGVWRSRMLSRAVHWRGRAVDGVALLRAKIDDLELATSWLIRFAS